MENASKALIIAGAILISILLISVGIIIMNAINDPVSRAGDSAASQAIDIFNNQFAAFAGRQSVATIKTLIAKVNASNGANPQHQIRVNTGGTTLAQLYASRDDWMVTPVYRTGNAATDVSPNHLATVIAGVQNPQSEAGYICGINIATP